MCAEKTSTGIRTRQVCDGLEIVEAIGLRHPYQPHRHACYVVGITTGGVQSFDYRGERQSALPGQAFTIHPDETHDGRPGTKASYGYRAAYVTPALISDALGGSVIPFVLETVGDNPFLLQALNEIFELETDSASGLSVAGCVASLADAFVSMSQQGRRQIAPSEASVARCILKDLRDNLLNGTAMSELEQAYGLDRFKIARIFRRQFGITPRRYQLQIRVALARQMIERGVPLADTAYAVGFADQSHMTRQFVKTLGLTPGQWQAVTNPN